MLFCLMVYYLQFEGGCLYYSYEKGTAMGKTKYNTIKTVMILMCMGRLVETNAWAQNQTDVLWSKSAKSLAVFQPGDAVRIQVWELYQKENRNLPLSGDYPINPDGMIIMPLLGEIKVKGMTNYELMQILKDKFANYLNDPFIYVRPLIRITMQGAFNRPGAYRADPSSSLWDLVQIAGGPDSNCDLNRMRVERGGKVVIRKLLSSFEKGYSLDDVGIESGDQIVATWRSSWDVNRLLNLINFIATISLLLLRLRNVEY
jgi:protein involved in polysaccharide export with SLBB domain